MLKPLDRCCRNFTLFQFTTRRLKDFIDPDHLLIRIDEQFDFARLVAPLEDRTVRTTADPPSTLKSWSGRCSSAPCTTSSLSGD